MRISPEPADPNVPDWKHKLREEARKLLELQEQNRITRAAQRSHDLTAGSVSMSLLCL